MSIDKLFIADPFNDEHIEKFNIFEDKNSIETKTSTYLKDIKRKYTKDDYEEKMKTNNIINKVLFLENEEGIKDCCFITVEKDRKIATLYFPKLKENIKNRTILSMAVNYSFNALNIEEIFTTVSTDNTSFIVTLQKNGFESLGAENDTEIFVNQKEQEKQIGRVI